MGNTHSWFVDALHLSSGVVSDPKTHNNVLDGNDSLAVQPRQARGRTGKREYDIRKKNYKSTPHSC